MVLYNASLVISLLGGKIVSKLQTRSKVSLSLVTKESGPLTFLFYLLFSLKYKTSTRSIVNFDPWGSFAV